MLLIAQDATTANAVVSVISSLGFPIFACLYMMYLNNKQNTEHKDEIKSLTEAHNNEISTITTAINELKVAIASLTEYIKK